MSRLGFYFDMSKCVACKTCQVACKDKNNLAPGVFFRKVITAEVEEDGNARLRNYSGACNHCASPACVDVCPTGAMHILEDGTVSPYLGRCIGCGSCVWSCPYGAPQFSKSAGSSQKCDSCVDLRAQGKNPACVDACITHCLRFGDLDSLNQEYGPGLVRSLSILPKESETDPSLLIRTAPSRETFVVLGGGVAGMSAAMAIRERDASARIILIGEEAHPPYSRPMLTKTPGFYSETAIHTLEQYEQKGIELLLNRKILSLDTSAKIVSTSEGERIRYDKCVYALGASCFVPPIPGSGKEAVVTIRHREDIEEIRRRMLNTKNAVVIGGGAIGLETSWELKKSGIDVTLLEVENTLMERLLDSQSACVLQEAVKKTGIHVVTGARIERIEGGESAESVVLADGSSYPAELVALSCGTRPNIQLAKETAVETGRGVLINKYMETGVSGIYACGDCAELNGACSGTWAQAEAQGRAAGANAAGDNAAYEAEPAYILLHAFETSMFSVGDMGKKNGKSYEFVTVKAAPGPCGYKVNPHENTEGAYERLCFSEGKLVGATLMGNLSKMRALAEEIKKAGERL